jgi:plasmid stabilization system protein ParE
VTGQRRVCEIHDLARDDINAIVDYIKIEQPGASVRWALALQNTFELLQQFPMAGKRIGSSETSIGGIRAMTVGRFRSYVVIYEGYPEKVVVMRVVRVGFDLGAL